MVLKECMLVRNECYRSHAKADMTGIVVHDTGAGNTSLKRYVQPVIGQDHYTEILNDLGKNKNGNHWNQGKAEGWTRQACVHYFIGKNEDGEIETYQTLPLDICAWGVGSGTKGSYNFNPNARIQFEICDDGYVSEKYFYAAMKEAQELCAYLCKQYGWDASKICCHYESYKQGYGGNHSDIEPWLNKFGKDMDWFRAEVQKLLDQKDEDKDMTRDETQALIDENKEKVYHYYSELPDYARDAVKAMADKGYFSHSAKDLALRQTKMEMLVIMARVLKDNGIINY